MTAADSFLFFRQGLYLRYDTTNDRTAIHNQVLVLMRIIESLNNEGGVKVECVPFELIYSIIV